MSALVRVTLILLCSRMERPPHLKISGGRQRSSAPSVCCPGSTYVQFSSCSHLVSVSRPANLASEIVNDSTPSLIILAGPSSFTGTLISGACTTCTVSGLNWNSTCDLPSAVLNVARLATPGG